VILGLLEVVVGGVGLAGLDVGVLLLRMALRVVEARVRIAVAFGAVVVDPVGTDCLSVFTDVLLDDAFDELGGAGRIE